MDGAAERCSSVQGARSYASMFDVHPIPSHRRWFSYTVKVNRMPGDSARRLTLSDDAATSFAPLFCV